MHRSARARHALLLFSVLFTALAGSVRSAPANEPLRASSLHAIDRAQATGELSYSDATRQKLFYLFDRQRMEPQFNLEGTRPARCATLVLDDIRQNLDRLDPDTRALYESSVSPAPEAVLSYETTHFYIEYNTTGTSAVPLDDVSPANGVPDYIEWTATSAEFSWSTEVTSLGYHSPPASSASLYNGKYLIQFQAQASYGFTTVLSGQRTKIVLHNNFLGFPPNDDPEGDQIGALRVTMAHEFKHAIQRTYTNWTEGGWVELDATWMEDIVYDNVNDYYQYLAGPGSPFTEPQTPLDMAAAATTGSYEDCNWQHYQTEKLGNGHMLNFWNRRQTHSNEPVLTTYEQNLIASGATFADAWGEYVAWNFNCGDHAGSGFGYGEAPGYPTTTVTSQLTALPQPSTAGSVQHLASNIHLVSNGDGAIGGTPEFTFNGEAATNWRVSVVLRDLAGNSTRLPVTLVAGMGTLLANGFDYTDLSAAALVIGNPSQSGAAAPYAFSARAVAPLYVAHQRLWDTTQTGSPYTLEARITSGTATLDASSLSLVYRVNGGAEQSLPLSATGDPDEYAADVPAQPVGSTIEYRFVAHSTTGDVVSSPARAGNYYGFSVVSVFEPFETAGAWTVGDLGDAATTGVWQLAIPVGTSAAPDSDFTLPPGQSCFVTENAAPGAPPGTADVDGGKTTLLSPVFDLSSGGPYSRVSVRYHRWYSNHLGASFDDTWRVDASNDGGSTWTNIETEPQGQNAWVPVSVELLALFGTVNQLRFRFIAEDQGSGSLVEAAVDDFELIAVPEPSVDVSGNSPIALRLGPAAPNPSSTSIRFALEVAPGTPVHAWVRDVRGRVVREVLPAGTRLTEGRTQLEWNGVGGAGSRLAAGIYFLEVESVAGHASRKFVLLP